MTSRLATQLPKIQSRQFSAQAAVASIQSANKSAQVSKAENGVTLISVDGTPGQLSTLGMVIKSGPRYETYNEQGISHCMRTVAGLATRNFTAFSIMRNIQQAGSLLQCEQGREHIFYSTQVLNNKVDDVIDYFLDAVGNQVFKPWEVSDNSFRMNLDLEKLDPSVSADELLHRAAYRQGLGYSIYSPSYMIGKHKPAALQSFYNNTFTAPRSALVGIGIDHKVLEKFSTILNLESGAGPSVKSNYFGGELRQDRGGKIAFVALAGETPGASSAKDMVTCNLLQRILGNGSSFNYSLKSAPGNGKIDKAIGRDNNGEVVGKGINFAYSDTGLLGVAIKAEASLAGKAVEAAAQTLRSLTVSNEELNAAKKSLLVETLSQINNQSQMAESYGQQVLNGQEIVTGQSMADIAQGVSLGDVQAVAKRLSSGKLSMSAVGNLETVPYLDTL